MFYLFIPLSDALGDHFKAWTLAAPGDTTGELVKQGGICPVFRL